MKRHIRILIAVSNRYDALLMEREISSVFPDSVTTTLYSLEGLLEEVSGAVYDALVVDNDLISISDQSLLPQLRSLDSELTIILLAEPGDATAANRAIESRLDRLVIREPSFHRLLPDHIRRRKGESIPTVAADRHQIAVLLANESGRQDSLIVSLENDINNPLMTIMGTVELLLSETSDFEPDVAMKLRTVRRSARRIQKVLAELSRETRLSVLT